MSTIVGTTLNADTIRKTGGSLGTDIRIKNTSVYESDGGTSVTQNLVQGVLKMWVMSTEPGSIGDSFNVSSQADGGTGNYQNTLTNNMNSTSSCPTGGSQYAENDGFGTPTTSVIQQYLLNRTDSLANADGRVYFHLTGDLA